MQEELSSLDLLEEVSAIETLLGLELVGVALASIWCLPVLRL